MPTPNKLKILQLPGKLIHETENAYLIAFDDGPKFDENVWVPKSLSEWDMTEEILQVEEWFAIDKEFV